VAHAKTAIDRDDRAGDAGSRLSQAITTSADLVGAPEPSRLGSILPRLCWAPPSSAVSVRLMNWDHVGSDANASQLPWVTDRGEPDQAAFDAGN
jgi:hypothetical protein